jgi:hypothetical protein
MQTDPQFKAIETQYKGFRFRSRLEARWAVFFDHLSVRWEYESEGFNLKNAFYLPDFHIPPQSRTAGASWWLEIKPDNESAKDTRIFELGRMVGEPAATWPPSTNVAMLIGQIPGPEWWGNSGEIPGYSEGEFHAEVPGDSPYLWCICPCGKCIGLQFDGRGARIPCTCRTEGNDKEFSYSHPELIAAYLAARAARFEHGENGVPSNWRPSL